MQSNVSFRCTTEGFDIYIPYDVNTTVPLGRVLTILLTIPCAEHHISVAHL